MFVLSHSNAAWNSRSRFQLHSSRGYLDRAIWFPYIQGMSDSFKTVCEGFSLVADVITIILGCIGLWQIIFNHKKIALAFKVLTSNFSDEHVKRIKETLGKLEATSFDNKAHRPEIRALLGQLSGQIYIFLEVSEPLKKTRQEITSLLADPKKINEATKRRIASELHGGLDTLSFEDKNKILE